jgi:hypothetical protein
MRMLNASGAAYLFPHGAHAASHRSLVQARAVINLTTGSGKFCRRIAPWFSRGQEADAVWARVKAIDELRCAHAVLHRRGAFITVSGSKQRDSQPRVAALIGSGGASVPRPEATDMAADVGQGGALQGGRPSSSCRLLWPSFVAVLAGPRR